MIAHTCTAEKESSVQHAKNVVKIIKFLNKKVVHLQYVYSYCAKFEKKMVKNFLSCTKQKQFTTLNDIKWLTSTI